MTKLTIMLSKILSAILLPITLGETFSSVVPQNKILPQVKVLTSILKHPS